ncbi:hypothetical protein CVT24_013083 [Panaeolus cyanescens]|uniref:Uncharacterized protein n=1 Tax=Panaeolus cyanescens TaxID=181874 RepID=A0A409VVI8_9AGAR|nr:hypothetical protein CVT24_013083 [Panaeolus cyanescens]
MSTDSDNSTQSPPAGELSRTMEKVNDQQGLLEPRVITLERYHGQERFHIPKKCPGLRNKHPSKGKIVKPYVYAIPITVEDMEFFLRKYWPEPLPNDLEIHPLLTYQYFLSRFPGRPEGVDSIAHLLVPVKSGGIFEPYGVVIAHNLTQESIDSVAHSDEVVRRIQEIFEFDCEPGWYGFVNTSR